jgi:uncharacterized membrane protein
MRAFFVDLIGQLFTLLGMFIAWIVLDGTAKGIVGYAIMFAVAVWIVTYPIRRQRNENE